MDPKEEEKTTIVDWLKLPEPLTTHVMSKLTSICDYARFGVVCVQWRSIFLQEHSSSNHPQLPLLMIPTPPSKKKKNNKNKKTISFSFFRVTDGKIYNRLRFSMPRDRYIRGSGYGWFVTVDEDELCCSVQLMNPFLYPSTMEIKLPSVATHPHEEYSPGFINYVFLRKAVLSSDPVTNPKDFMVMAIFSGAAGLAFCKIGDKAWTPIEHECIESVFFDVVYYEGKFYALSQEGSIVVCNVAERTVTKIAGPPVLGYYCCQNYLVVSVGELFQVHRRFNDRNVTKQFKIFKLKRQGETSIEWIEVKDLGDRAFFVGDNPSMSFSCIDFPGCRRNCIYYTDDNVIHQYYHRDDPTYRGARDLGVFNLENRRFEKHYYPTVAKMKLWPPPIWIEPTLVERNIIHSKRNMKKSLCFVE